MATQQQIDARRAVIEYHEQHPGQHDQDYVGRSDGCGTTMCIAGTALHLAGCLEWHTERDAEYADVPTGEREAWLAEPHGRSAAWCEKATELLGLSPETACDLFFADDAKAMSLLRTLAAEEATE